MEDSWIEMILGCLECGHTPDSNGLMSEQALSPAPTWKCFWTALQLWRGLVDRDAATILRRDARNKGRGLFDDLISHCNRPITHFPIVKMH